MSAWRLFLVGSIAAILALGVYVRVSRTHPPAVDIAAAMRASCEGVSHAFRNRESGTWVTLAGTVTRMLPDAHGTRTHQRFVVSCESGQTVLTVNDVDLGTRVPVRTGLRVAVRGQYVWNALGGLVHFTHRDRAGSSRDGWIVFEGRIYALGLPARRPDWMSLQYPIVARRANVNII